MTVGFVALWKNNQREYTASPSDEWGTSDTIQAAFALGRERGNRTYGLYACRWSSPWQYMTFWVSPSMEAVFDTIADLERAGDFKFADSLHIVGQYLPNAAARTEGAWDVVPEPVAGEPSPLGVVLLERATRAAAEGGERPGQPAIPGIRLYGAFDCRFGTAWDRFVLATADNADALAAFLDRREQIRVGTGVETQAVTGQLTTYFRFGTHLQTSLTWLNEEDASA
jgi:hypothetical protein